MKMMCSADWICFCYCYWSEKGKSYSVYCLVVNFEIEYCSKVTRILAFFELFFQLLHLFSLKFFNLCCSVHAKEAVQEHEAQNKTGKSSRGQESSKNFSWALTRGRIGFVENEMPFSMPLFFLTNDHVPSKTGKSGIFATSCPILLKGRSRASELYLSPPFLHCLWFRC